MTLAANVPLVEDLADRVLAVRPRGLGATVVDLARALRALRTEAPELSLDFEQFAVVGALLCRAAGVPQRIGFTSGARGRDGLLTVRVPLRRDAHASRSFRDLAEAAGVAPGPYVAGGARRGRRGPRARCGAPRRRSPRPPLVVLHPGSGDNFPGRRWSPRAFAAAGRHARDRHGARVVVTGGVGERGLVGRGRARRAAAARVGRRAGRSRCGASSALLGAGARRRQQRHRAGAPRVGARPRPCSRSSGPTRRRSTGRCRPARGPSSPGLPCSPCLTTDNYRSSRCRIHTCMAAIPTGEVVSALSRLLSRADRGAVRPPAPAEESA